MASTRQKRSKTYGKRKKPSCTKRRRQKLRRARRAEAANRDLRAKMRRDIPKGWDPKPQPGLLVVTGSSGRSVRDPDLDRPIVETVDTGDLDLGPSVPVYGEKLSTQCKPQTVRVILRRRSRGVVPQRELQNLHALLTRHGTSLRRTFGDYPLDLLVYAKSPRQARKLARVKARELLATYRLRDYFKVDRKVATSTY